MDESTGEAAAIDDNIPELTIYDLASCAQPQGDLAIEKTVKLLKSEKGVSELEYTVTVRNTGNVTATAVTFHDELDAESVTYVPESTTLNGHDVPDEDGVFPYQEVRYINGATVEGNELADDVDLFRGVIPPNDQATVTFRVTAEKQDKVCNQGRVASLSVQDGILSDDPSVMGREPTVDPTCIELSDPNITIDKIGHPDPIDLTTAQRYGDETFELPYTIRVTNDGDVAGEYPPIRDLPENYKGFKIVGMEYGQLNARGEAKTDENGERLYASANNFGTEKEPEFRVPSGVIVNGKTIEIPIRLIVSAKDVAEDFDWSQFGECREGGTSDGASKGFINTVVKPSVPGSEESRDTACDEIRVPQFSVKKEANGAKPELTWDAGENAFVFTRTYKVTVTNTGEIEATSSKVFDKPILGEGTELTELKVNGTSVKAGEDGRYLISDGVVLEAGKTQDFTVVLSGTMTADAAAKLPADNSGVCEALDPSKPTAVKGIVNTVSMRGDSDDEGDRNNIVCDPVPWKDPKFVIDKQAQEGDVVVTWDEEQGKFTFKREYSITVKNNGVAPGNSGVVYDQPALREGLEIASFTTDGGEALTADDEGRYVLSKGVDLAPGGKQVFKVSIAGTVTRDVVEALPATEDQCKAANNEPSAATGLVNIAMLGDGTGEGEKDIECNPVKNPETQFAVEKESADDTPVELEWDQDANAYAFTRSYNVTVTNQGDVKGTSAAIYDEPQSDGGVTIAEVKVDGEAVEADEVTGGYLVSEGVELDAKKTKSFEVTISGTMSSERVEQIIANEAEQCLVTAPGASAFGQGLVNVVRMDGDSDEEGESNNIACDPVTPPTPGLDITKLVNDQDADIAANAPVVAPGEDMTITYRVKNTGTMLLRDVKITDVVTQAKDDEAKGALQQAIDAELAKLEAVDIAPGTVAEFTITVPAAAGGHENEARPTVPPVTVPGTTRPGTTVPGTTNETTTVPGTTDPGTTVPGTEITVTTPSDPGRANDPQIAIVKSINGQDANDVADAPVVAPGEDMEITYTVTNTGNVALEGVHVVDEVTEGAAKDELQQAIDAELEKLDAVDLEPGESKDFTVTVKATKGGHVDVARPTVPPVTVPGTTRPGTTVPGTTESGTTVPGTTDPGTTVPGTEVTVTTPSDPGRVNDPRIEINKTINGQDANHAADAPVIAPGEDMTITYTLTNTGNVDFTGVHVLDQVTEGAAKDELQQAINAELKKLKAVDLAAGTAAEFTVKVKATKGGHENEARPTVPPVTVPGTTRPGTTVPGTTNETTTVPGTTDPGTTVPGTEITVTTPSDPGRVNDPQVAITKLINGEDANEPESAVTVAAGAPMTISYVVSNPGNVDLTGVNVVDVVEGEDNADLQADIDEALKGVEPFDLAAGESTTVTVEVDAPEGAHKNVARPTVPPVTIPGTTVPDSTVPGTTVPGTTNETTTDPGTTKPGTTVPGTTVSSTVVTVTTPTDPGHSTPEPKAGLEVKKYINGRDADSLDDAAAIVPGDDMVITYRVVNTGNVDYFGLALADTVTQSPEGALGEAIAEQLDEQVGTFDLPAGQGREFTVTVTAEEGTHENEVVVEVPSTVPGTTNETTTNPGTTNPVPSTVPSDKGGSKDYALRIKKFVDGFDAEASGDASATVVPTVTPGADMVIRYVVENTGNTPLSGVRIVDEVEGDSEVAGKLQQDIEAALADKTVDLEPKTSTEVEVTVPAPAEAHVNFAHPVAVTTVPEVTIPATTLPGTTIPETVVSSTVVTVTAPKDRGASTPTVDTPVPEPTPEPNPQLEIVKTINGKDADFAADAPVVAPGEDMNIVYTVTNTGNVDFTGVHVLDQVTEGAAKDELQQAINAELKKLKAVDLAVGTAAEFKVTVPAVAGGHVNVARPTVPVSVPGTTVPGTTVPGTTESGTTKPGTTEPGTTVPGTTQQVPSTTPTDSGRVNDPQVAITKLINGEDANEPESAVTVAAGAPMTISYVVSNPGNVDLTGVNVVDVVEGEDNADLQADIDEALKGVEPFDLAAGESTTVTVEVDAPEGAHKNVARPTVPPVTIPGTTVPDSTVPGTTVPGTTNETTTDPGTTKPGTTVPGTTVSSTVVTVTTPTDPGHSTPEPKAGLEVKKYINGRDDNALVTAGEDMEITYRVTNTGETTIDGIRLLDEVKEDNADLQQQIDAQLGKQPSFGLAPGESRDVTVTVKAPVGRHDNVVRVTVPPVTVPGTTEPGTTVPGTTDPNTTVPGTTVPGTTNPGTTVTLTSTPSDDASSDSPQLAIVKEIKGVDEDEDAWRDAEEAHDALPVKPGADMQLRYTVTNTGSVALAGIDVVDSVTRLDDGDADEFAALINEALEGEGRGFALAPGESKAIVITVAAPEGYHVNEAIATAPPVTATETVVTSVPGTTDATTTVPGTVTTETTVVERVPNTPVDKAQSTPTVDPTPCDCTVETTTITPSPVTVTRTTPVTTVQTITPEPSTVVTTVTGPTATTTPKVPGQVVVVVDEDDKAVTTVSPTPTDGYVPEVTHTATYTLPPVTTVTVTDTPVTSTTKTSVINKCVANAVRSPLLYMVPLALAGQVLGDAAAPYVAQINDRFNQISNEIQEEIRRNTPDLGFGRRGHENEQVAQLRARLDEANRQLGQLMNRPEVREYGKWAAVALGVVVAGSVLYDWCTNEEGEAFTAIGPKKTTTIDDVRVGGSSLLGRGGVATSVAPVTQTTEGETTDGDVEADAGSADSSSTGLLDGSSDGSSEGSSDGSSEGSSGSSK
ncbi:DUF7507 domain-containing protein [Corynebacterium ihumii]|uniref:DUF7507 domain-containing protein n=1 Tax=Corynebacterium ihumii TaxID=1232427 RepID=UPI002358C8F6|nr:hypothetical protein [Corynebacterium ihumii]